MGTDCKEDVSEPLIAYEVWSGHQEKLLPLEDYPALGWDPWIHTGLVPGLPAYSPRPGC